MSLYWQRKSRISEIGFDWRHFLSRAEPLALFRFYTTGTSLNTLIHTFNEGCNHNSAPLS